MGKDIKMVSLDGSGTVVSTGRERGERIPGPDEPAPPWNDCTIPGCTHIPPCPAKLRGWGQYGTRYTCRDEGCDHEGCPARLLAIEDQQPFGVQYWGPVLPQHMVGPDGRPLGPRMRAVQQPDGTWRLVPVEKR